MKARPFAYAALALVLVVLLVAVGTVFRSEYEARRVERLFGEGEGFATVSRADEIQAYRLAPLPKEKQGKRLPLDEYPVLAGPVPVPPEHAKPITQALSSFDSFGWEYAKGCIPIYGVRLLLERGADRVDVLLCFECDVMTAYHNGKSVGGEDFDKIRPLLVRAMKATFPDDPVIKALKERD